MESVKLSRNGKENIIFILVFILANIFFGSLVYFDIMPNPFGYIIEQSSEIGYLFGKFLLELFR
jgi:hypothetical protein